MKRGTGEEFGNGNQPKLNRAMGEIAENALFGGTEFWETQFTATPINNISEENYGEYNYG